MYNESIKIQIGKIFMNHTRKYLLPIVKLYGVEFTNHINRLNKVAIGIGDMFVEECGFKHEKHLFILVDSRINRKIFISSLKWIKKHHAYEDDYVYGNILKSRFHMIVIKIPESYIPSLNKFRESKFSKMYSKKDISLLFNLSGKNGEMLEMYKRIRKVLIHDHNYKFQFAKQVRETFDVPNFTVSDVSDDVEFELPISKIQEIFNYTPKQDELI